MSRQLPPSIQTKVALSETVHESSKTLYPFCHFGNRCESLYDRLPCGRNSFFFRKSYCPGTLNAITMLRIIFLGGYTNAFDSNLKYWFYPKILPVYRQNTNGADVLFSSILLLNWRYKKTVNICYCYCWPHLKAQKWPVAIIEKYNKTANIVNRQLTPTLFQMQFQNIGPWGKKNDNNNNNKIFSTNMFPPPSPFNLWHPISTLLHNIWAGTYCLTQKLKENKTSFALISTVSKIYLAARFLWNVMFCWL